MPLPDESGREPTPTFEQYERGLNAFRDCLRSKGYDLIGMRRTQQAGVTIFQYAVPGEAVSSGAEETCYAETFAEVDQAWQRQIGDYYRENPHEDLTYVTFRTCVTRYGLQVPPSAGVNELQDALERSGLLEQCLAEFHGVESEVSGEPEADA